MVGPRVLCSGARDLLFALDLLDRRDGLLDVVDFLANPCRFIFRFERIDDLFQGRDQLLVLSDQRIEVAAIRVLVPQALDEFLEEILDAFLFDEFERTAK